MFIVINVSCSSFDVAIRDKNSSILNSISPSRQTLCPYCSLKFAVGYKHCRNKQHKCQRVSKRTIATEENVPCFMFLQWEFSSKQPETHFRSIFYKKQQWRNNLHTIAPFVNTMKTFQKLFAEILIENCSFVMLLSDKETRF